MNGPFPDVYVEPSKQPAQEPFETLLRIMGARRPALGLLIVLGHLGIRLLADANGGSS